MITRLLRGVTFIAGNVYEPNRDSFSVAFKATPEVKEVLDGLGVEEKESTSGKYYRATSSLRPLISCHSVKNMRALRQANEMAAYRNLHIEKVLAARKVDLVVTPFKFSHHGGGIGLGVNEIRLDSIDLLYAVAAYDPHAELFAST